MLKLRSQQRHLRSSTSCSLFAVPRTRCSTFAERPFSVNGPKMWNTLPTQIRNASSLTSFKTLLKAPIPVDLLIVHLCLSALEQTFYVGALLSFIWSNQWNQCKSGGFALPFLVYDLPLPHFAFNALSLHKVWLTTQGRLVFYFNITPGALFSHHDIRHTQV